MGEGMAAYIHKDLSQGTKSLTEYNNYCYTVAGLVGEGLSAQFYESKLENSQFLIQKGINSLSSQMGMFLQKTNIIRDYYEDLDSDSAEKIFSSLLDDKPPLPGSSRGRKSSAPEKNKTNGARDA